MHSKGLRLSDIEHKPCTNGRASNADGGERGVQASHCVRMMLTVRNDQHIDLHQSTLRRSANVEAYDVRPPPALGNECGCDVRESDGGGENGEVALSVRDSSRGGPATNLQPISALMAVRIGAWR